MKSIIKGFVFLLIALVLQSFISPERNSSGITKKIPGDSVNVNINIKNQAPKIDPNVYANLQQLLQQNIELNTAKQKVYDKFLNKKSYLSKEDSIFINSNSFEQRCFEVGFTSKIIFNRARSDTTIKFISSWILIIVPTILIYLLIIKSISKGIDWKNTLILSILIICSIYLLNYKLEYIISYLFNRDYLVFKELIF
jgi:hypothetical protein